MTSNTRVTSNSCQRERFVANWKALKLVNGQIYVPSATLRCMEEDLLQHEALYLVIYTRLKLNQDQDQNFSVEVFSTFLNVTDD
ncbi:hypothetical protein ElyMa_006519600 [Elysia marginata]|uniref:Uncharacterized protein n=1 Tax=Elysia marginata TaxID=1093978 RepID=A0AAV4I510_9GAST|nr:hypothetical protein ElyMa_006519600 [Elysia marginata]